MCAFCLFFLQICKITVTAILCLSPDIECPTSAVYDATLTERRPQRLAGAYRSSRKKKHPI